MFPWRWLALLALVPVSLGANAGVKVKLTQKGLERGRALVVGVLQEKLKAIKVPDISGSQRVDPIGKVQYSLTDMHIVDLGLPSSDMGLLPGTGVTLSISHAFLKLHGNWRVKYMKFLKDSGTFDLQIKELTIATSTSVRSDETGRPALATANCSSSLGAVSIKFHGGASWLYNLFTKAIEKSLRSSLQQQICPLVAKSVNDMNQYLKTLKVLVPVDKKAEIAYPMVSSPEITNASIGFNLKGEFYNIGKHAEPPVAPAPFFLPNLEENMLVMGISSFTANSASFVYNKAGALYIEITDDMIPSGSPIRLNTNVFGTLIPQIAKMYPDLKMELDVKMRKDPLINLDADNVTLGVVSSVTAYAIQLNASLTPLFVLNLDANISAKVYVTGSNLAGAIALKELGMSLVKSYVGEFQVAALYNICQLVLKQAVIPSVNDKLKQGYPLPSLGRVTLTNTKLKVMKGFILIGTDIK